MRWGLIARSEVDRGLGIQTSNIYDNLKPDRTLCVLVPQSGYASHPERYPDATFITLTDDGLDEATVRDWWSGLDVVVSVETLYDWRLTEWAKADNVRTVVQGNPEFHIAAERQPDVWWWPTTWRLNELPEGRLVPVPVPDVPIVAGDPDGPIQFLHIAGAHAMEDRNGYHAVAQAGRRLKGARLNIYAQAGGFGPSYWARTNKNVVEHGAVEDRWSMYEGQHVLLLPRRYGGLCLPALEAMASGLALAMTDCSPNTDWPIVPISSSNGKSVFFQAGWITIRDVTANSVASTMNVLMDPQTLSGLMRRSREWAEENRWSVLASTYHDAIEAAASR